MTWSVFFYVYFGIALLDLWMIAFISFAIRRRFRIFSAFISALFWPFTCIFVIVTAALVTESYPNWYND